MASPSCLIRAGKLRNLRNTLTSYRPIKPRRGLRLRELYFPIGLVYATTREDELNLMFYTFVSYKSALTWCHRKNGTIFGEMSSYSVLSHVPPMKNSKNAARSFCSRVKRPLSLT